MAAAPTPAAAAAASAHAPRAAIPAPPPAHAELIWEPVYHALLAAEKLFTALGGTAGEDAALAALPPASYAHAPPDWHPAVRAARAAPRITAAAVDLLIHPHAWVRMAAARLVGLHLASAPAAAPAAAAPAPWLASPPALLALCMRCVSQLASRALGPRLAEQATKNLVAATLLLADAARLPAAAAPAVAGAAAAPALAADPLLAVFFRATTAAASRGGDACRLAVLKWLAACALRLPAADTLRCLAPAARLLHRLVNEAVVGAAGAGGCSAEVKALAGEALELLQGALGVGAVVGALSEERRRCAERRAARTAARAQLKVTAPQAAAREKIERQAVKRRGARAGGYQGKKGRTQ